MSTGKEQRREVGRRDLLKALGAASACGAAAAVAGPAMHAFGQQAPGEGAPGWIDAHVHVWTPDTERYPLAAGFRREEMVPRSFTPEELLSHATPCGVRRIVLIQMSFYGFDNSYMLDAMEQHDGVFSGVAVIDDDARRPQDEMRRLAERGVRGFRIYPRNRPLERWLAGDGMEAMWRCGADEGLAMCHLINPDALASVDAMCERYPRTPVVIDHFGRVGIDGIIRERDVAALCRLARHPETSVKVSAFYALGKKQPPYDDLIPMIRRLVEAFGPQRLMWATDCPYQVTSHRYLDSLELIRDRCDFLSAEDKAWILRKTAERVFFS